MDTIPVPACPVCGATGEILYRDLPDKLFGTSGVWTFRRCTDCDSLWLDPRPRDLRRSYQFYHTHLDPIDANAGSVRGKILRAIYKPIKGGYLRAHFKYHEGVGPAWWGVFAPLAFLHPAGIDAIADDAMFLSAPSTGARLLEVGCGNGSLLAKMQTRGWQVEGVEFDPECVKRVEARGLKCYGRDLRELGLPSETFDAIYMGHVIEHLYDPGSLLKECWRVLKPGGHLVMTTPNMQSWGHKHYRQDWRGLESPRHLQIFNPQSLRRLTEASGFDRCRVRTTNRSAWYMLGMSAALRKTRQKSLSHRAAMLSMVSLRAMSFQILGRLLNFFQRDAGEEIILTARKP
jgi:2-polyprenyl-3-methyl-5-hydroxy-6-metoxy-1,4-benzoquinol methylase